MIESSAGRRRLHTMLRSPRWFGVCLSGICLLLTACATPQAATTANNFPPFPTPTATPYGQLPNPNPNYGGNPTNTPPPDLTSHPLPAFSDWRVAYIASDSHLHAVSLSGKTDSAGSAVPIQGISGTGVWTAGASPDGHNLALYSPTQLTLLNAASGVRQTTSLPVGDSSLSWSPDQRYVALDNGDSVICVSVANGARVTIPLHSSAHPWAGGFSGWLDATHLAVSDFSAPASAPSTLERLDTTTNGVQRIATLPIPPREMSFVVSPDGIYTLASDAQYQDAPFTPVVDLINNATGSVTPLPHITSILPASGGFTQILWRPGSLRAIATTGFPQNGNLRYWLIDLSNDTTVRLNLPGFPEAWSPDGGALVAASGGPTSDANGLGFKDVGGAGSGPYTLSALSVDAQGGISAPVILTTQAIAIPVLGFLRTA